MSKDTVFVDGDVRDGSEDVGDEAGDGETEMIGGERTRSFESSPGPLEDEPLLKVLLDATG